MITPDDSTYEVLTKYFGSKDIKLAIKMMSPVGQTSRIESANSDVAMFAPKHLSFGYAGMRARYLDHNVRISASTGSAS